jgi:hypothetical protein
MQISEQLSSLSWEFQWLDRNTAVSADLLEQLLQVCEDGFGTPAADWRDGTLEKLGASTVLGKLLDAAGRLYGFVFYSAPAQPLLGSHLLWEDGICMVKAVQQKGYPRRAISKVAELFPERRFYWLGCRTQNPAMMLRYAKFGKLYPFDESYDSPDGQVIMNFLLNYIEEVKTTHRCGKLDTTSGICNRFYSQGRLGDYPVNLEKAARFEDQLKVWGFQREFGDAIVLTSLITQ